MNRRRSIQVIACLLASIALLGCKQKEPSLDLEDGVKDGLQQFWEEQREQHRPRKDHA